MENEYLQPVRQICFDPADLEFNPPPVSSRLSIVRRFWGDVYVRIDYPFGSYKTMLLKGVPDEGFEKLKAMVGQEIALIYT